MTMRSTGIAATDATFLQPASDRESGFKTRRMLPALHGRTIGPFVLVDQMGPTEFDSGRGLDRAPHPHIGLEMITYLINGEIAHRDNCGNAQISRAGEVDWMAAGSGIVHSERTPAEIRTPGGNLFAIQTWIALPSRHEEAAADFRHYGAMEIPRTCARGVEFNLIAGASDGLTSPVRTFSDLVYAEIVLTSGARYQVKPGYHERAIYVVAGEVEIVGQAGTFRETELILLEPGIEIVLGAPAFHSARLMLMGGEPLSKPRHLYWNFVSSSVERIEQAKADWRDRRFPGVPGEDDFVPLPDDRYLP